MEGTTEKDKLIMALKVSGLRTALWNMRVYLYEIEKDDEFPYYFEREVIEAIHVINNLLYKCDNHLDSYVANFKENKHV